MTDQIPDFEPPAPMFEDPKPAKKPRRKPTKRKAKRAAAPEPKRVVKKRRVVKRRGRPPGAVNKPKPVVAEGYVSSLATILGVHAKIEALLSQLSFAERKAMLECLK